MHKAVLSGSSGLGTWVHSGASHLKISEVRRLAGVVRDGRERRDMDNVLRRKMRHPPPQPNSLWSSESVKEKVRDS